MDKACQKRGENRSVVANKSKHLVQVRTRPWKDGGFLRNARGTCPGDTAQDASRNHSAMRPQFKQGNREQPAHYGPGTFDSYIFLPIAHPLSLGSSYAMYVDAPPKQGHAPKAVRTLA